MGWVTTETAPAIAVAISALSLVISFFSAWYARAQYKKRLADERPIIWLERSQRGHHAFDLVVRNRSTSDIRGHFLEVRRPSSAGVSGYWDAMPDDGRGGREFSAKALRESASRRAVSKIVAKKAGTETIIHQHFGPDYGETAREPFFPHLPSPSPGKPVTLRLRFIWSFKEETSRKRVAHVNIELIADTNAAVTVR